jgi:transcriptional regulator with XRE-family HTH domain
MTAREFLKQKIAQGESQSSIANRIGTSQATIWNLINGREPSYSILSKLATVYGSEFDTEGVYLKVDYRISDSDINKIATAVVDLIAERLTRKESRNEL